MPAQHIIDAAAEIVTIDQGSGKITDTSITMADSPGPPAEEELDDDIGWNAYTRLTEDMMAVEALRDWRRVQSFWKAALIGAAQKLHALEKRSFKAYLLHMGSRALKV